MSNGLVSQTISTQQVSQDYIQLDGISGLSTGRMSPNCPLYGHCQIIHFEGCFQTMLTQQVSPDLSTKWVVPDKVHLADVSRPCLAGEHPFSG